MKKLLQLAIAMVLLGSCRKVDELAATPGKAVAVNGQGSSIENLGHVFSGTNITWKIHPLDPGNTPMFTYLPNQKSGYCLLMIDNGNLNGVTPIHAIRFVAVNMQTLTSKIVNVIGKDGNPANYSLGRVVRCIWGMDKKFYVATEGSPTGGGHLIQYNPDTQTALDLGKPFIKDGNYLAIYSLNVGTDGALYGGSFGGDGEVMTFRYDYKSFYVDKKAMDNTSRYVAYVSGDQRYTYAVCGKNNWNLYAIDRQTGETRVLKSNPGSTVPIDVASYTDAAYAHSVATHYKLAGFTITPLREYYAPSTARLGYNPYAETNKTVPKVLWDNVHNQVQYQLANGQSGTIPVGGLQQDTYSTDGPMLFFNNKLYLACEKQALLASYTPGFGFKTIGRASMSLQTLAVAPVGSANANKIFMGGYPKGELEQYSLDREWNVNLQSFSSGTTGRATATTNPMQCGLLQNPDASGTNGSMSLLGIACTKNGYIAGAGNNDRITVSSGRELSMSSFKNGTVRNLYLPDFSNYEFTSLCPSKDSNYVYVSATTHSGDAGKLFKYDPATNSVVGSWNFPISATDKNADFKALDNNTLVGFTGDTIFLIDVTTGQVIYKNALGQGQKIYAMALDANNTVYINYMYKSPLNFRFVKYNFNYSNKSKVTATSAAVVELADQDADEHCKPTRMVLAAAATPGSYYLYVGGLLSLYRIKI